MLTVEDSSMVRENTNHSVQMCQHSFQQMAQDHQRPSVLMRPELTLDGDAYCMLYGRDLMSGCCGFGSTPAEAAEDFDNNWCKSSPNYK